MPAANKLFLWSLTADAAPLSSHSSPLTGTLRIQRFLSLHRLHEGLDHWLEGLDHWLEGVKTVTWGLALVVEGLHQ